VELVIVCAVMAIIAMAAVPLYTGATRRSSADGGAQVIAQQLNYARALAVSSHASVTVQFDPAANTVVVAPGSGSMRGPFPLGTGVQLLTTALSPDSPDGLGSTVLGVGGNTQMSFLDNGAVVDNIVTNNLRSGTFFLQHNSGDVASRRAVTLLGGTGRIHIWRYDPGSSAWK
jgi:Tfp pilus assembly protein FimT